MLASHLPADSAAQEIQLPYSPGAHTPTDRRQSSSPGTLRLASHDFGHEDDKIVRTEEELRADANHDTDHAASFSSFSCRVLLRRACKKIHQRTASEEDCNDRLLKSPRNAETQ
jgi:hypothetical protein